MSYSHLEREHILFFFNIKFFKRRLHEEIVYVVKRREVLKQAIPPVTHEGKLNETKINIVVR